MPHGSPETRDHLGGSLRKGLMKKEWKLEDRAIYYGDLNRPEGVEGKVFELTRQNGHLCLVFSADGTGEVIISNTKCFRRLKPKRDCIRCFRVSELEAEIALLHTLHRDAHQVKVMLKDALTQISQTTTTERGSKELAREALKLLSLGGKAAEPRQHRFLVRLAGSVSPGSYVLCPVDGIPELDRLWAEGITVTFSETEELAALKFVP